MHICDVLQKIDFITLRSNLTFSELSIIYLDILENLTYFKTVKINVEAT